MQSPPQLILILIALAGLIGLTTLAIAVTRRPARPSPALIGAALLPSVGMLFLFYSLALHMHHTLGGWPEVIGKRDFPAALSLHADMATSYFSSLLLVIMLALPAAFLLCTCVRQWRMALPYLGIFTLACSVALAAMILAPAGFLYWWWD